MLTHLVTGGSGFLGNLIARRLCEKGDKVRILDVWEDASKPNDIEYIHCNILDRDSVYRAMKGVDIVHHNAALVPLTKSGNRFWEVNVEGSRIAAEEAIRAGVKTFIHMSSSAVYGLPHDMPITSSTPCQPIEIYGRGKLAGEQAVRGICSKAGLPLIVIRPRTLLGEGRLGIFQILFDWIKESRKIYLIGNGENAFQFLHAHDLLSAYMLAYEKEQPATYNVGTDRYGTLKESLFNLIRYAGSSSQITPLPAGLVINALTILDKMRLSPLAPWHYLTYHKPFCFDLAPLQALGWKARYSNDEMLRESYDWFLKHYDRINSEKAGSAHRRPVREALLGILRKLS